MESRIIQHPILPVTPKKKIVFYWQGKALFANRGEPIASALIIYLPIESLQARNGFRKIL